MEKERFRLRPFLRTVRDMYKERYADHKDLEVPVVLEGSERSKLQEYLRADRAPGDGK